MKAELSPLSEIRPAGALVSLNQDELERISQALYQLSEYPERIHSDGKKQYFDPETSVNLGREFAYVWLEIHYKERIEPL